MNVTCTAAYNNILKSQIFDSSDYQCDNLEGH